MQTIYNKDTGEAYTGHAIDCRELMASGQWQKMQPEAVVTTTPMVEPASKKSASKRKQAE